jgi:hypothetical protein
MDLNQSPSTRVPTVKGPGRLMSSRLPGALLTLVIVELTIATGYVHLTLGGALFTLNGFGYLALAGLYLFGAAVPISIVERFSWLPRIALAGYAVVTIGAYLWTGTYFTLGWITKGIELAIVGLVAVDLLRAFGDPDGFRTAVLRSLPERAGGGPRHA